MKMNILELNNVDPDVARGVNVPGWRRVCGDLPENKESHPCLVVDPEPGFVQRGSAGTCLDVFELDYS